MTALLWVDEGPLRKSLERGLDELSLRIRELEDGVEAYFSRDLPQYQSWVNHRFADDLVQISGLEKKIRCLGQHVQESVELSMEMNLHPAELFAEWSEEEMLEKLLHDESELDGACGDQEFVAVSGTKEIASADVREVYRRIARCLHPDLRGSMLSELDKNIWVKAQQAYAKNDGFELTRLEQSLRCGNVDSEPVSYSELLRQLDDFQKRCSQLEQELVCLQDERAWKFSGKDELRDLEKSVTSELKLTLKDLKSKEQHLHQTISSWIKDKQIPEAVTSKAKRRPSKSQVSLF